MKTIDLHLFGQPHPADPDIRFFLTLEEGKKVAGLCGLKDAVMEDEVDIILKGDSERGWGTSHRATIQDSFIRGFFGDVAREVGIPLFMKRVRVNGVPLTGGRYGLPVWHTAKKYLLDEEKRLEKTAEEKARATGNTTWSDPGQFLIPDIGTVIKLESDWTFRLYSESRNGTILKFIGREVTNWRKTMETHLITILAGSELTVDRVYIRKGVSDYSSLTFHLRKNGVIRFEGKEIKAKGRFWAKLVDVNQMKVRVDMATLAGN
jgi:hypothetical protein